MKKREKSGMWGLYIHLPFCRSRCPYCAFVSGTGADETAMASYIGALMEEWGHRRCAFGAFDPRTLYVGGGTPSIVPARLLSRLFTAVPRDSLVECTIEANPESATSDWLKAVRDLGADRISIGVQALDDATLVRLGRIHTVEQAQRSVQAARDAGFRNLSIDLMYGVPGQTVASWAETVAKALDLGPDHVSAYALAVETDTEYCRRAAASGLDLPDEDAVADMYLHLCGMCASAGMHRYEISNFALPDRECRHNGGYWEFAPYLGLGAGAHSFAGGDTVTENVRSWNESDPDVYIRRVENGNFEPPFREPFDATARTTERIMLGLRTARGFDPSSVAMPVRINIRERLETWVAAGLCLAVGDGFTVTDRGALLVDELAAELAALI